MTISPPELAPVVFVVVLLASRRFDLPSSVREYATALRYAIGIGGYVLTSVLVYFVLYALCLRLSLPAPVYLAFGLTLAISSIPTVAALDLKLRESFHQVAGVPAEVRRLASMLTPDRFLPPPGLEQEVRSILLLRGYDVDDDWLPAAVPVRRLWLHSAMCFFLVRGWEKPDAETGYRRFMAGRARQDFDELRQRFDQLSCQVVRVLSMVEKLADLWCEEAAQASGDAAGREEQREQEKRQIVNELLSDLREDIAFFQDSLSAFIARGVLSASYTERQRRRRLSRLGFMTERDGTSLTVTLFWVGLFYLAAFFFLAHLRGRQPFARPQDMTWLFILAATQTMALAVAIAPKRMFGFANENLAGRTPWGFVVGAGAAAVAIAFLLRALLIPEFLNNVVSPLTLWLISPFSTAAAMAWLVQDSRWSRVGSDHGRRLRDALVLTAAVGVATIAVRILGFVLFDRTWSTGMLPFDFGLALSVGIVIGYNVPSRFRNQVLAADATTQDSRHHHGLLGYFRTHATLGSGR